MQARRWIHWAITLIASPIILFAFQPPSPSPSPEELTLNAHPVYSDIFNPTYHDWPKHPPKFSTFQNATNRGTNYVYQIPASPIGVLFLAHGCGRSALVFWDAHSGCPRCLGLPEERAFLIAAIERRFAVIAISSTGVCWNLEEDVDNVGSILREWIRRKGIERLPIVALGSSTGGWFVSRFANLFRFDAIVLMVAEARLREVNVMSYPYPPVMFAHMVKDVIRAKQIRVDMTELMERGVAVAELVCRQVPIFAEFFSLRIPYIGKATSAEMVAALVANRVLTKERVMKGDARWFDWRSVFEERQLLPPQLRDHVEQELNVAFAFHEFSSLVAPEILQWLDFQIQALNFTYHLSSQLLVP